jgi:cytidine deaminase
MVTEEQWAALLGAACEVRERAYAPYSNYRVGAAVLAKDGRVFTGVNIENAAYGMTVCAEQAAVFAAVTAGVRGLLAVAVCTENAGSPCGACRQVISEFADDIPVKMCDAEGNVRDSTLNSLLPDQFGPEHLKH